MAMSQRHPTGLSEKGSLRLKKGASLSSRSRGGEDRSRGGQSKKALPQLHIENADLLNSLTAEDVGLG